MTLLNESRAADISLKNAELMIETAQLYYDTAMDKLNSGVLTESESQSIFMEAEAAAKKSKNALIRAIEKVIDFIKSAIAKISKAFSDRKVKKDIEAIKKIQNDPDVKNLKVEIPDYKEHDKNIKDYEKSIKDAKKKANTGKLTQADIDKMDAAKKKCIAKKKMIAIGAAAGAVAIGGLVIASRETLSSIEMELRNLQTDADESGWRAENLKKARQRSADDKYVNGKDDHNFDTISYHQRDIEYDRATKAYAVKKNEIELDKLKAEREILYGSTWRKCITTLKRFLDGKKSTRNADYKFASQDSIAQSINNYQQSVDEGRESIIEMSRPLHDTKKQDKIDYANELERRKKEEEEKAEEERRRIQEEKRMEKEREEQRRRDEEEIWQRRIEATRQEWERKNAKKKAMEEYYDRLDREDEERRRKEKDARKKKARQLDEEIRKKRRAT